MSLDLYWNGSSDNLPYANGGGERAWAVDDTPAATEFVSLQQSASSFGTNTLIASFAPFTFAAAEAINDYVALGSPEMTFGKVYFHFNNNSVQGVGGAVTWQYWNGSWTNLSGVTDGTVGFTDDSLIQTLTFTVPSDWAKTTVNGTSAYWIRAILTTVYSTNPDYGGWRIADYRNTNYYFTEVWGVDAPSTEFIDNTTDARDDDDADFGPFDFTAAEVSGDYAAFGCYQQFGRVRFDDANGTQGVGGTGVWEYWNGSSWSSLTVGTDDTSGFTSAVGDDKILAFTVPGDWAKTTINSGESLYYIRFRLTAAFTTNPVLDQAMPQWLNLLLPVDGQNAIDIETGADPLRQHTGTILPKDWEDEHPAVTWNVSNDSTVVGITVWQQNDVAFDLELVGDTGVEATVTTSPDANGMTYQEVSISLLAAAALYARMVLTDGSNPGAVAVTATRIHTVVTEGVALQVVDAPETEEGLANFAQMYFGGSATVGNYMVWNGRDADSNQATRNVISEGRAPIDGVISIMIIACATDQKDFELWVEGVSQGRFLGHTFGGDERDHYATFRPNVAVSKNDKIAIQFQHATQATWCQLWISPNDGEVAPMQYTFGGDMQTADRAMEWMELSSSVERVVDGMRQICPILYSGIVNEVILSREIAGSTFRLRVNGVNVGDTFSDDGVNAVTPLQLNEGDTLQVVTTVGAGATNRCQATVNVIPDDLTKSGVLIPINGDPGTDYDNRNFIVHGAAWDGAITSGGPATKFHSPRDLTVRRFGGISDLGSLEVSIGVDQNWIKATAADRLTNQAGLAEIGLILPRNKKMMISQLLGGGQTAMILYAD